jgi:hypothetical protein
MQRLSEAKAAIVNPSYHGFMGLTMSFERDVQKSNGQHNKIKKLLVQTLNSFIFELWTLLQVQKCNKNNGMSILALGDRPRTQKNVLQVAQGGTMPSATV